MQINKKIIEALEDFNITQKDIQSIQYVPGYSKGKNNCKIRQMKGLDMYELRFKQAPDIRFYYDPETQIWTPGKPMHKKNSQ